VCTHKYTPDNEGDSSGALRKQFGRNVGRLVDWSVTCLRPFPALALIAALPAGQASCACTFRRKPQFDHYLQEGSSMLKIECTPMHIHNEDQEDGEFRPDLDFSLQISPAGGGPPKRF
jgi:hypothetical protein